MWEYPPSPGERLGRTEEYERAMKGTGKRPSPLFDSFTTCNLFGAVVACILSGGSRPSDKGEGGGGAGHQDPEIEGGGRPPTNFFFVFFFGLKIRWGVPPGSLHCICH